MEDRTVDGRPSPGPPSWQGVLFALCSLDAKESDGKTTACPSNDFKTHAMDAKQQRVHTNGEAQRLPAGPLAGQRLTTANYNNSKVTSSVVPSCGS